MNSQQLFLYMCLNVLQYTDACMLGKCEPGTQNCVKDCKVGEDCLGADCSGWIGCLSKCPPGSWPFDPLGKFRIVLSYINY